MRVVFLKNDGRCKWAEKKVLKRLFPEMIAAAKDPTKKTMYLIEDWISNDSGKVGIDLKWLQSIGVPVIKSIKDLPKGNNYRIVNTGYDSIVHEEKILLEKGIEYVDEPCPYVRNLRTIFENADADYQYVLLCEPNHIIIKNFQEILPEDLILVQNNSFREKIFEQQNGKPFRLVPYVTFLAAHIKQIAEFIAREFPNRSCETFQTSCMWIASPSSPIREIENLKPEQLNGIQDALLITSSGSTNRSLSSLLEALQEKGLHVIVISSLEEFLEYEKSNRHGKVLLVRSPIPNKAEKPIVSYIQTNAYAVAY